VPCCVLEMRRQELGDTSFSNRQFYVSSISSLFFDDLSFLASDQIYYFPCVTSLSYLQDHGGSVDSAGVNIALC
jgi:hypothetical protein